MPVIVVVLFVFVVVVFFFFVVVVVLFFVVVVVFFFVVVTRRRPSARPRRKQTQTDGGGGGVATADGRARGPVTLVVLFFLPSFSPLGFGYSTRRASRTVVVVVVVADVSPVYTQSAVAAVRSFKRFGKHWHRRRRPGRKVKKRKEKHTTEPWKKKRESARAVGITSRARARKRGLDRLCYTPLRNAVVVVTRRRPLGSRAWFLNVIVFYCRFVFLFIFYNTSTTCGRCLCCPRGDGAEPTRRRRRKSESGCGSANQRYRLDETYSACNTLSVGECLYRELLKIWRIRCNCNAITRVCTCSGNFI